MNPISSRSCCNFNVILHSRPRLVLTVILVSTAIFAACLLASVPILISGVAALSTGVGLSIILSIFRASVLKNNSQNVPQQKKWQEPSKKQIEKAKFALNLFKVPVKTSEIPEFIDLNSDITAKKIEELHAFILKVHEKEPFKFFYNAKGVKTTDLEACFKNITYAFSKDFSNDRNLQVVLLHCINYIDLFRKTNDKANIENMLRPFVFDIANAMINCSAGALTELRPKYFEVIEPAYREHRELLEKAKENDLLPFKLQFTDGSFLDKLTFEESLYKLLQAYRGQLLNQILDEMFPQNSHLRNITEHYWKVFRQEFHLAGQDMRTDYTDFVSLNQVGNDARIRAQFLKLHSPMGCINYIQMSLSKEEVSQERIIDPALFNDWFQENHKLTEDQSLFENDMMTIKASAIFTLLRDLGILKG